MKLLALETANEQCSVSIINETQTLFFQHDERAKAQTQTILPMIEQGLQQTKSITQALAWSNDLPVIAVSTLQALAQAAFREAQLTQVTAVLDARMKEVYMASFQLDDNQIMQLVDEEKLLDYQQATEYQKFTLIGSGSVLIHADSIQYQHSTASAEDIAAIARLSALNQEWVSAEYALPVYLRDNAWKKIPEQGKP